MVSDRAASTSAPFATFGKGAQTRRAILEAAIARFGREGYRVTSVADIARDALVGGTVAYAYFTSKEALFLEAVDHDAAALINEGLSSAVAETSVRNWRQKMILTLFDALDRHPLARRLLAGLEPEVTARVLELPALNELRRVCADRLAAEQRHGAVRPDIDPVSIANGLVTITLALMRSIVQVGPQAALLYGKDVEAVFEAALDPILNSSA
jgi:AcrR family transcriptional regulator